MSRFPRWHSGPPVRVSIAVGLAMVGVALVWAAMARPSTPDRALAGAPAGQRASISASASKPTPARSTARSRTDVRDKITGLVLPESHPETVSIPRLGVHSRLDDLGLQKDGTMEVPQESARAGWFRRGPTPGEL